MRVCDITKARLGKVRDPIKQPFTRGCKLQSDLDLLPAGIAQGVLQIPCGIEVECEGVEEGLTEPNPEYWQGKEDDSLRGNGYEFITWQGMRISHCGYALENLMAVANERGWKVSDRTSIHVHLNALNLTMDQLNGLIILYTVCEQALFNYAAAHRAHNIFCVPFESHLFGRNYESMEQLIHESHKYSSLNLKSVYTHGTVEFRHMETAYEVEPVWNWVMLLGLLHRYATITPLAQIRDQVCKLKIMSEYDTFLKRIFHGYAKFLRYNPIDLDSAVSDSKLLFF